MQNNASLEQGAAKMQTSQMQNIIRRFLTVVPLREKKKQLFRCDAKTLSLAAVNSAF